ncbi:DUF4129 domain-containing protein [Halovenus halobia]|uniref:DUF4129 domain-containing protein n=1 Tax=Halovenus halobia TaxID=3396622 RepID=UPI003F54A60C
MDPGTRNALLITVVAILALGVAAATLSTTTQPQSDGSGGGGGFGPQPGLPNVDFDPPEPAETGPAPLFSLILATLLLLSVLGALIYAILYRRRTAVAVALGLLVILIVWIVLQLLGNVGSTGGFGFGSGGLGGLGDGGSSSDTTTQPAQLLALAFVVGALAVGGFLLLRSRDTPNPSEEPSTEPDSDEEIAQVGEIAGRAADRIEATAEADSIDNQVYRAYREMTDQLDIDHGDSMTPREFANAAAARGMAATDVAALTDLFEEVRYGGLDATADREDEAKRTLRRIEQRYTDE